ncbi:MAG: hypothetical protein WED15_03995 [Akkermansiaceae bacterium]
MTKPILLFLALAAASPAHAELPALADRNWLGTFAGFENSSMRFQFSADGTAIIHPLFKDKSLES